ncbi:hypothetical protein LOD99_7102 [Oopsacas minuta]|uniref:TRAF-type domain-containing protein n=1 Tax=Oopsacas minuta TaxID=111878 RepID=A0AAV7JIY2_9METZ|nr:hypothetical protein LOD99_7102 [Oopsacas minuta]
MVRRLEKDCGRVVEKCKLDCGIELPHDELNMRMHVNEKCREQVCSKFLLECELGCSTVAYREDMARHLEEECVEKKVECPFIKYKCEVGLIKRKELNQHLKEKRTEHTELKLSAMGEIVMQQNEMINKDSEWIYEQTENISKQSEIITKQNEKIFEKSHRLIRSVVQK